MWEQSVGFLFLFFFCWSCIFKVDSEGHISESKVTHFSFYLEDSKKKKCVKEKQVVATELTIQTNKAAAIVCLDYLYCTQESQKGYWRATDFSVVISSHLEGTF